MYRDAISLDTVFYMNNELVKKIYLIINGRFWKGYY